MAETIRVTDETTRAELIEALGNLCAYAKRQPHVLGVSSPSRWDLAHRRIDAVLDEMGRRA
ncbi:hypothetical protein [Nocardioides montaniterrae]